MMSTATQGSAGTNEVLSPTAKMENEIRSKPKKPQMTTKQREFTFTGYDIMADTGSKPPAKKETEAEKKLRKHVECYIFSCKRLGITPSRYLCRHMNDKELVMKSHPLGPKGTRALCVSLVNNDCVESLDLRDNDIGSEGALCISEMLEENDTLTELVRV